MQLSVITNEDLPEVAALTPADWSDISLSLGEYVRDSQHHPYKWSLDEQVVGIGAATILGETAWLSYIIVSPEFRGRGIGKSITDYLIAFCQSQNCSTLYLIATAMGEPVYKKSGFEYETDYLHFEDVNLKQAPEQDDNILQFSPEYREQLLALDQLASGEQRTPILEPHLDSALVYVSGQQLLGYYLPTLKDGLIIATQPEAGKAFMQLRLQNQTKAIFPQENLAALEMLTSLGYTVTKRLKRMRLGKPRTWHPEMLYNRIGGNLG